MKTTFEGVTSAILKAAGKLGSAAFSVGCIALGTWLVTSGVVDCKNLVLKPKQTNVE